MTDDTAPDDRSAELVSSRVEGGARFEHVAPEDIMPRIELEERTGKMSSQLMVMAEDGHFPRMRRLGVGRWVWRRDEVEAWLRSHDRAKQNGAPN